MLYYVHDFKAMQMPNMDLKSIMFVLLIATAEFYITYTQRKRKQVFLNLLAVSNLILVPRTNGS